MTLVSDELPHGWDLPTVSDVTETVRSVDPTRQPDQTFYYVDISSIDNEKLEITEPKRILGANAPSRAKRPIHDGDVLFSNVRTYLRNIARVTDVPSPAVASTGFTLLRPISRVTQDYLFRYVSSDAFIRAVTPLQTGSHYPATSDTVIRAQQIPLPPLAEQRALTEQLDQIDAHRDGATSHLSQARQVLNNFRRAVLAAACSGRLTEDWRSQHPDAESLDAVIGERGCRGPRRRGERTTTPDVELPDLPATYVVATIGDAAEFIEYGTSQRADAGVEGVPVLRMGNIQDGKLDTRGLKYCTADAEIQRLMLADGDLLFNRTNSPELVGKAAVFHESASMTFASYLIRVRFDPRIADPNFVSYWINSAWGRLWARQVKTDGVSQSNINGTKLGAMPLPLPPVEEQREVVRRVEQLLAGSATTLAQIGVAEKLLQRTGEAATAKAFRGELIGELRT